MILLFYKQVQLLRGPDPHWTPFPLPKWQLPVLMHPRNSDFSDAILKYHSYRKKKFKNKKNKGNKNYKVWSSLNSRILLPKGWGRNMRKGEERWSYCEFNFRLKIHVICPFWTGDHDRVAGRREIWVYTSTQELEIFRAGINECIQSLYRRQMQNKMLIFCWRVPSHYFPPIYEYWCFTYFLNTNFLY